MTRQRDGQWGLTNTAAGRWDRTRDPGLRPNVDTKADHVPDAALTKDELDAFLRSDRVGRMAILKALGKDRIVENQRKRNRYLQIMLTKLPDKY